MRKRYEPSVHPFDDTDVIDQRAPRTNQAVVAVVTGVAFLTDVWPLVSLMGLQLIMGLVLGRRWCVSCWLYFKILQPRFGEGRIEDSRPPRFANIVGAVFMSAATVLFLAGAETAGWAVTLIVTALAGFAAISGICVGCEMYVQFARIRGKTLATTR